MSKQLNVDLRFNADTSAAKAQLQSLQTSITQLTTSMATQGTQLGITPQLQQAQQAAVQLKTALQQSMNVETGKFDLSKFNSSLKSMNTDLSKLKTQLVNLGPSGQQTFMTLAQSIMTAEIPTKRISASLAALGTTLKNTAKWQLSSTMLHGFMSAVQTSYRYAQDLNKSLNNIRIVTGESAGAMDQFAARANKAAKALSASTLDYTNAALIYYQQGLKGKDVEERAEVTLKLANVSRQSAEVVSDQMTAIWNNFYDGSKSLEYYADALTALGASTASSTDEIAGGLEKFAAIGNTIGLSYEYAAAALATITANTRQSEEVVGTALKTIFARMEGLKLGETLEDGVELNKYSEALQAVGVHIFDANHELKDMDTILDETAAKWSGLSRDQQAALAQTVAGVRQYNQFIALMDNWNDGTNDSMKANLDTIANSTGTLQDQADIYAESWEAANKRVKASAEALYTSILDDDFFIDLSNGFADLLDDVKVFVEAIGGVKGILLGLSGILLHTFSGAAAQGLENMVYNLRSFMGFAQKDAMNMKNQVAGMINNMGSGMQLTNQQQGSLAGAQQQVQLQNEINQLSSKWTDQQKAQAQNIMEINRLYGEQVALLGEAVDKANQQKQTSKNNMLEQTLGNTQEFRETLTKINKDVDISSNLIEQANKLEQEFAEGKIEAKKFGEEMDKLSKKARNSGLGTLASDFHRGAEKPEGKKKILADAEAREDNRSKREIYARWDITRKRRYNENNPDRNRGMRGVGNEEIENYVRDAQNARGTLEKFAEGQKVLEKATEEAKQKLQELNNTSRNWSQTAVGVAQGMSSIGFGIQSLSSMFKTLTDDSASFSDKLLSAFTGLGMALPMLINGFNSLKTSIMGSNTVKILSIALGKKEIDTLNSLQLAKLTGMGIEEADAALKAILMKDKIIEIALSKELNEEEKKKQIMQITGLSLEKTEALLESEDIARDLQQILIGEISLKQLAKKTWATITYTAAVIKKAVAEAIAKAIAGDYSGVIILVTAGLIAGTAALIGYAAAQEAENQKIAEGNEKLDNATEAYEQATQRAKEFKEAITGYEEAVDSLKDLVSGTDEYTEALKKANAEATKMIDMYPDMKYTIENGLIKISSADYQEHYKKLQNQAEMFDTIRIQAEAGVKKDENEKSFKQITKDLGNDFGIQNYQGLKGTQGGYSHDIQGVNYKDEFVKALQHKSYEDQKDLLNNKTALKELFGQIKLDNKGDLGTESEFEKWADNIVNASESEKEVILNNISALRENTAALRAEVEANQQQKYGERFVAEHGIAEIYGAEIEIAKQKKSDIDWDSKKDGKQSSYADYIDDIMNLYNNTEHLTNKSATDAAMVAKIFGIEEGSFDGRELRVRQGDKTKGESGTVYLTGDKTTGGYNSEKDSDLKMSIEEFDARAAVISNKLTITEQEIDTLLKSAEGREKAKQMALDSGLYDYRDMLVTSDQTDVNADKTYDLMTVGQKEDLTKRFESEQLTEETENRIKDYLQGVDSSIKQKVADKLLQMSNEQLNAMGDEDLDKLSKEETDAFYSRDIGRLAQDEANTYGIDPGTLKDVAEGFREMGEAGDEVYKNIKDDSQALVDAARNYIRLNTAIQDIKENYEDYSKVIKDLANKDLKASEKGVIKNSESAKKLRKTLADLLDTTENLVDSDLLEAIDPKDFEKAAQGDIKAIGKIRDAFIDLQVKGIQGIDAQDFKDELNALAEGADIEVNTKADINLDDYIAKLVEAEIRAGASEIDIESKLSGMGISIDGMQFFDTLDEAKAYAEETGNILVNNLSFDTTQETGQTEVEGNMPDTTFTETLTYNKVPWQAKVMQDDATEATSLSGWGVAGTKTTKSTTTPNPFKNVFAGVGQTVSNGAGKTGKKGKFAVINGAKKKAGNSYNPNFGSNKGNPTGGNGGGGGGKGGGGGGTSSKPAKKSRVTKKTDTVDRYKETNDQLNKIKDTIEDTSREMDTLWGPKRLKVMDKYGKSLQKQIQIQEKYKQEIVDSLAIDKKAIQDFMKEMPNGEIGGLGDLGLSFNFDENGFITNYTGVMTTLHAKLNEMEAHKNSLGTEEAQSEYEDSTLGPFKERIDELKNLVGQYDDTNQLLMDADNEYQEMIIEWQQNNYDQIVYKVELQVEFSELQLEQVEYYLDKIQDDWYSAAEGVTLYGDQIVPLTNNIQSYIEMLDELKTKLNNNEINQAQYMEGLKEVQSGLIDNINTLQDALESVGEYYLNTLDQINEKLDIQTSKFDGLTSVLEHYKEITILINGEKDYKTLNNIVKSQRKLAEDQLAVSERKLTMYENQKTQIQSEIDKAKLLQDDELRRQTLDKLEQDMAEIDNLIADEQSSIMEHITTLAELAMEELTNTLAEAKKRMEEAILGGEGLSIDSMLSQIERLNTKQEEYLTNTNKLYETNKLIRQAQMDMDKTDNQRAKQHYNDYIKYIEQLQQSGQLTQFELEMAQAEYDVLQKKIALEEAQEAKNQVRLTRDSEGNYGYVYTANQENIDKAEQEFADAQNARYNKALEGAKKYQDQYYQAIADMESDLEELEEKRANHLITDEEYEKRRAEIVDTYLTIAETSYELYFKATGIMMEESSNNLLDYELKGVGNMENLRDATERYIEDSNKAFTTYDQKIDEVALHSEENFGKVEEGVGDVEKASQDLVLEINNNLIPTMENELAETLTNSMNQWYALATAIKTAREEAEKAMDVIQKETKLEGGFITDYSDEIAKELEKGEKADYEYINSLLAARDKKMGYLDTYDYSQMMEDYLAGDGKDTDAMYKAYELLRKHKIDMWNNIDFNQMLKDHLASNGKIDDEKAKKILEARAQKINVLGITSAISNEELIKQLTGGNASATTETTTASEEKKEDSAAAPDLVVGNKVEVKSGTKWYGSSAGTGGTGTAKGGTIKYINEGSNYPYNIDGLGWIKKSDIVGYNTGGYTGDWGPEGKLAILHEKELVLNAQDTENFLGGIAVLREISQMLDNNALIASLGAINLHAMTIDSPADQILQQEVTIHADFPNVTDHNEIEIAIDNLINAASQHAYQV